MKAKATVKRIGGSLMIPIPRTIIELLDIKEGDVLNIPFLDFEKTEHEEYLKLPQFYEPIGKKEITIRVKECEPITITQKDIIEILENSDPEDEIQNFRTVFIVWNGKRYGVKKVISKIIGKNVFNTAQAANYLRKLGFVIGKY
jgi:hypothetical protein